MQKSKLFNIYLGVVSIFSILAIAINLGVILTMLGRFIIISDDEYIISRGSDYKFEQCEKGFSDDELVRIKEGDNNITTNKNQQEIEACKENVKKELITRRRLNMKEDMITAGAWFIVFVFLFGFHYPKFKRYKEEEKK